MTSIPAPSQPDPDPEQPHGTARAGGDARGEDAAWAGGDARTRDAARVDGSTRADRAAHATGAPRADDAIPADRAARADSAAQPEGAAQAASTTQSDRAALAGSTPRPAELAGLSLLDGEGEVSVDSVAGLAAGVASWDSLEAHGSLSDGELVDLIGAGARLEAYAASVQRRAAAALERRTDLGEKLIVARERNRDTAAGQDISTPARLRTFRVSEAASDEIAMRLGISRPAAARMIGEGQLLTGNLTVVGDALTEGEISPAKATVLVDTLRDQDLPVCLAVCEGALPAAPGLTPTALERRAHALLFQTDPAAAARRHERARDFRNLSGVRTLADGMARLTLTTTLLDATAVHTVADLAARAAKADGDQRTLDQLRVDTLATMAHAALGRGSIDPGSAGPSLPGGPGGPTHPGGPTLPGGTGGPGDPGEPDRLGSSATRGSGSTNQPGSGNRAGPGSCEATGSGALDPPVSGTPDRPGPGTRSQRRREGFAEAGPGRLDVVDASRGSPDVARVASTNPTRRGIPAPTASGFIPPTRTPPVRCAFTSRHARTLRIRDDLASLPPGAPPPPGTAEEWAHALGCTGTEPECGIPDPDPAMETSRAPTTAEECSISWPPGWLVPEISGYGPLDHATARRLVQHPPPWLAVVRLTEADLRPDPSSGAGPSPCPRSRPSLGPGPSSSPRPDPSLSPRGTDPNGVPTAAPPAEDGYLPSAGLRRAVNRIHSTCVAPTCSIPSRLLPARPRHPVPHRTHGARQPPAAVRAASPAQDPPWPQLHPRSRERHRHLDHRHGTHLHLRPRRHHYPPIAKSESDLSGAQLSEHNGLGDTQRPVRAPAPFIAPARPVNLAAPDPARQPQIAPPPSALLPASAASSSRRRSIASSRTIRYQMNSANPANTNHSTA